MKAWGTLCAAIVIGICCSPASASLIAYDDASDVAYNDGWTSGDNGGFGWGAGWTFRNGANTQLFPPDGNVSFYGSFANSSSLGNNNPAGAGGDSNTDGDIDTAGDESWGLYANTSNEIYAVRPFQRRRAQRWADGRLRLRQRKRHDRRRARGAPGLQRQRTGQLTRVRVPFRRRR